MTLHAQLDHLDAARELRGFQTEPAQMRAGASGKVGELRLGFSMRNGRSVLSDLYRVAPLLVQRHRLPEARGKILHARRLLHLRPVPEQLRLQETLSLRERQSRASHPSDHC